jgi:hypothetical protein
MVKTMWFASAADRAPGDNIVHAPLALPPSSRVSVGEVNLRQVSPGDWDRDATRSGASMRSAHSHLVRLGMRFFLRGSARTFRIHLVNDGRPTPIGHYTILLRRGVKRFYDGLNLFPEYRDRWMQAMTEALRDAGEGCYEYGWQWNPEPPRDVQLASIPGVKVISSQPILVQGVDFSHWPRWESYYRAVSENARRNAKRAQKLHRDLALNVITGIATLGQVPCLVAMRAAMYRRKGLRFNSHRMFMGSVAGTLVCPSQAIIALAVGGGRVLAIQRNVEFGDVHYFIDGAASARPDGGAWFLQLGLLRRAYQKTPNGKYLMGYVGSGETDERAEGLLRSRRALRVTDWAASLIRFDWRPVLMA